ncbi:MAG: GAF and ANTAR domain-containing protein [Nocardioidaceae bacterium]|nr:GAF and ANTAR domain-containing protein [Nocardioidaceae bacterium]
METPPVDEFAAVARSLSSAPDVDETLERIVQLAVRSLGCHYAGVSYVEQRTKRVETGAASHDVVRAGDQAQYEVGEGPCLQAMEDDTSYLVHDTVRDPRWPRWSARADELGLRSVIGVRLFDEGSTMGALNLYSGRAHSFTDDDVDVAQVYAAHASVALGSAREESHLRLAIDARHQVGLAQGILMERFELDQQQAFAVLRRYSQQHNVKLRHVAEQLVVTRSLPTAQVVASLDAGAEVLENPA